MRVIHVMFLRANLSPIIEAGPLFWQVRLFPAFKS